MFASLSRRAFSVTLASLFGYTRMGHHLWSVPAQGSSEDVTRTSEAIHQEITLDAPPARVYTVLTDAAEFTKLTRFSSMQKAAPARIDRDEGGTFSLFDGHIVGRHLELVPSQRLVQAWRVADWPAGAFSIARFELSNRAGKTLLVFDHTGFPQGLGEHLAEGWRMNYWTPLAKLLASS
jgi:activator of HSP90 ATPase